MIGVGVNNRVRVVEQIRAERDRRSIGTEVEKIRFLLFLLKGVKGA